MSSAVQRRYFLAARKIFWGARRVPQPIALSTTIVPASSYATAKSDVPAAARFADGAADELRFFHVGTSSQQAGRSVKSR